MRHVSTIVVFAIALAICALTACDEPYAPDAPAIDPNAPRVHIASPALGTFAGDVDSLVVTGTASDDVSVANIEVNGVAAALGGDGRWTATVPVAPGTQLIHVVATDGVGNTGKESRAVVVGPMTTLAGAVPQAITATFSAQTFAAVGRAAAGTLANGDLASLIASANPVIDIGAGSAHNYVRGAITHVAAGPATTIALTPRPGRLALDAELDDVTVGLHVDLAVLGKKVSADFTVAARHIQVTGALNVGVDAGGFAIALVEQHVAVSSLTIDLDALPGELAAIIEGLDLDGVLGSALGLVTERLVVPMLNGALAGLANTHEVDVLGATLQIHVAPARIELDASGAIIELDTTLRAQGDAAGPGYVYIANEAPQRSTAHGFSLAVADDAVNQLLASVWAAKGLARGLDLATGSYGEIGKLYDRVELEAAVPPFIAADGGALTLTIGDLIATFKDGDAVATRVAVNAQVGVTLATGADGAPRLDVGTPTTYVDILDEGVAGANSLSNAQLEVITSFALARVLAVGSSALGSVPLPSLGGVSVQHLAVAEHAGYLVIDGDLP